MLPAAYCISSSSACLSSSGSASSAKKNHSGLIYATMCCASGLKRSSRSSAKVGFSVEFAPVSWLMRSWQYVRKNERTMPDSSGSAIAFICYDDSGPYDASLPGQLFKRIWRDSSLLILRFEDKL